MEPERDQATGLPILRKPHNSPQEPQTQANAGFQSPTYDPATEAPLLTLVLFQHQTKGLRVQIQLAKEAAEIRPMPRTAMMIQQMTEAVVKAFKDYLNIEGESEVMRA